MPVVKTRPAATVAEPMPSPASADQATFSVGENCVGSGFFDVETPLQFGPRNCGQSSAASKLGSSSHTRLGPVNRMSRRALAPVLLTLTGASALRLICGTEPDPQRQQRRALTRFS